MIYFWLELEVNIKDKTTSMQTIAHQNKYSFI